MVNESIASIVRKYLRNLLQQDIPVSYGVIFGSQVRGDAGQWSDINILVISPRFDENRQRAVSIYSGAWQRVPIAGLSLYQSGCNSL